jgi:hypothetical protein
VEERDRYEITVCLIETAPKDECTVNITPRGCSKFTPAPGSRFKWTNTVKSPSPPGDSRKEAQSGDVKADRWGLATLEGVKVSKTGNRIRINP